MSLSDGWQAKPHKRGGNGMYRLWENVSLAKSEYGRLWCSDHETLDAAKKKIGTFVNLGYRRFYVVHEGEIVYRIG